MEIDEAKFGRNWRATLAICLAYVAILTLFGVVALYQVAPVAPDASQAKARPNAPSVQSGPGRLAVAAEKARLAAARRYWSQPPCPESSRHAAQAPFVWRWDRNPGESHGTPSARRHQDS
jgi:hypothetical protein